MARIGPREVRYGGALFDQDESDLVTTQLPNPPGLMPGPKAMEFEARVAGYVGKAHGVMVNSASSAPMIALPLQDLPSDSEAVTPALTISSDVSCIYPTMTREHCACVHQVIDEFIRADGRYVP